ncbi:hypothetical protein EDD17DRAFT_1465594 [Pisolithus thermaeus]|nr:hypothetical protein EDD17DRAFT_1465594 [Pisolithus thermaeus]
MFPTAARLSKASRRPLTPKRGNKDFYKGTRQAALPGGHRTGAPGRFIVRGSGKYRLLDEKVRVFVAPHISEINQCEVSFPPTFLLQNGLSCPYSSNLTCTLKPMSLLRKERTYIP